MEKKTYSKPVIVAERFEPQEYCETCWYLDRSDAFTTLYHDTNRNSTFLGFNISDGYYNAGEQVTTPQPSTDFPSTGSYKVSERPMPANINDNYYYRGIRMDSYIFFELQRYTNHVTGPIYEFRNNGTTYYFDEIHTKGNAS